jgi:hypothetical protein
VIAVYARCLGYGFVFDDLSLVAHVDESATWLDYRPVRAWSWMLDAWLGGGRAWAYHAGNIVVHVAVAWLVLGLAAAVGVSRSMAMAAALWFALHPLAVEAVAYVSGRRDVLATLLVLGGLRLWTSAHAGRVLAPLLALAACGAKETGLLGPMLLIVTALSARYPAWSVAAGAGAGMAGLGWVVAYGAVGPWGPPWSLDGVAVAGNTLIHYCRQILAPRHLAIEYAAPIRFASDAASRSLAQLSLAAGAVAALLAGATVVARAVRHGCAPQRMPLLWAWCAALMLALFGGLHEPGADRHAYPLLALGAVAAAVAWERVIPAVGPRLLAAWLLVVLLAMVTSWRIPVWASEETLWVHAHQAAPWSLRAGVNLAAVRTDQGRLPRARRILRETLRRHPDEPVVALGLAHTACRQGHPLQARRWLARAWAGGASPAQVGAIGRTCPLPEFEGAQARPE